MIKTKIVTPFYLCVEQGRKGRLNPLWMSPTQQVYRSPSQWIRVRSPSLAKEILPLTDNADEAASYYEQLSSEDTTIPTEVSEDADERLALKHLTPPPPRYIPIDMDAIKLVRLSEKKAFC